MKRCYNEEEEIFEAPSNGFGFDPSPTDENSIIHPPSLPMADNGRLTEDRGRYDGNPKLGLLR